MNPPAIPARPEGDNAWQAELAALRQRVAELEAANAALQADQARQQAERDLFKRLIDGFPDGIGVAGSDGRMVYTNRAYRAMLGYSDRLVGTAVIDLHDEAPAYVRELIGQIAAQKRHTGWLTYKRADGTTFNGQVRTLNIYDDSGAPTAVAGIIRDVSATLQHETALRERQGLVQNVLDHLPVVVFVRDLQGRLLLANQACAALVSQEASDLPLPGQAMADLFPPDFVQAWRRSEQQVLTTGYPSPTSELVVHRNGPRAYLASMFPLYDEQGTIYALGGIATDITERKATEQALRSSRELLQTLLDHSPAAIYLKDLAGRFLLVNRQAASIMGRDAAQIVGQYDSDLFPPEVVAAWRAQKQGVLEQHGALIAEEVLPLADGLHTYLSSRFPLYDEQGTIYALGGIATDITERKATEQALRESEELFRQLAEHIEQVFWVREISDQRIIYISPAYETIWGRSRASLYADADSFLAAVHPEDRDATQEAFAHCMLQGSFNAEYRIVRPDGTLRWVWARAFPIADETGQVYRSVGIAEDITAMKATQDALRASKAHLQHILFSVNVVLYSCRPDGDFGATFMSENVVQLFGYPAHAFTDDSGFWASHIHPEDAPRVFADLQAIFTHGHHTHEYRFRHRDGSYRRVHDDLRLIYDAHGQPREMVGAWQDITEHEQLERELALREQRLQAFFTAAPAGLALFDADLRYRKINETAARMIGDRPVADYPGKTIPEVLPELAPTLMPLYEHVLTSGQPALNIEIDGETPGQPGVLRHWQLSVFPVPGPDGWPAGVGAIFVEITERKRTEKALQQAHDELERRVAERTAELSLTNELLVQENAERMRIEGALQEHRASLARQVAERTADLQIANAQLARAARLKDEFLANMSHELRTPLNAVLGLSEVLQEEIYGPLNPQQLTSLHTIAESGRHLLAMINDMLDLARIGAGQVELELDQIRVETICQASLRLIRQSAQQKHITLLEDYHELPGTFWADERRLKQVLVNLLNNGVKFTPDYGKVGLEVRSDATAAALYLTVWDTGLGIAQQDMHQLFQPFVQIDSGLSKRFEGPGLGLALVARLIEMHGGSVTIESTVGVGSRFTLALPWEPAAEPRAPTAALPAATDPPEAPDQLAGGHLPAAAPLVLLAEDNDRSIAQVVGCLAAQGCRCIIARSSDEALATIQQRRPDLVLLGLQMPQQGGLDTLRQLCEETSLDHVPVVALATLVLPGDRESYLDAGASDYFPMPVSPSRMHDLIQRLLPRAPWR